MFTRLALGVSWSLNWDDVAPSVLIGSCPMTVGDIDRIRQGTRATAILALQHDECLRPSGPLRGPVRIHL